jgi:hypothetical protein
MRVQQRDPWAGEPMSRSEAQRRYNNLVLYQLRPMLANRKLAELERIGVLKRLVREAGRFKYESGVVAGAGTREEIVDLLTPHLKPEYEATEEYRDWVKRAIRAFGATIESVDD